MYESITVEVDKACGDGTYRSQPINFTGRLVKTIEDSHITMSLYEWADHRGRLAFLVHVEEDRLGRLPRRTLYPFINTHLTRATPTKGYTAEEVSKAYPEFADGTFRGPTQGSPTT